jgi:DNA anti-recombination protein RmuC
MGEEIKDVNKKIDDMEAAAKKYASKDTVISIGGYEFTPAKLMVAFTLISSLLGGLYGCFEVYKDYVGMKKKIADYVSPDLTEIYKKLELVEQSSTKGTQYTQDIKNDLKTDIRRLEGVVDTLERNQRQSQRELNDSIENANREMKTTQREIDRNMQAVRKELQDSNRAQDVELRGLRREVDEKIKKALDNPLAK